MGKRSLKFLKKQFVVFLKKRSQLVADEKLIITFASAFKNASKKWACKTA